DDDYHLQLLSPCKNTGNSDTTGLNIPLVDLDGNPRIYEDIIDMGAYENQDQSVNIDYPRKDRIVFYPNPTKDVFYITGLEVLNIQVMNEHGQLIIENSSSTKIDLGPYANGIYLVKITTNKQILTRKLMKQ
ncbi:MAG: T9SS type A sorting domain-containing protein, partial [Bacteroidales bacterium]|nr:T9SS type A sorting domain-containing protein [Bacteroidales bacterium]